MTSLFRSAAGTMDGYFDRLAALRGALETRGDSLRLILSEGDSVDGTWAELRRRTKGYDATLVRKHHGGPYYGSVVNPERFWQLSLAANAALECVTPDIDVWVFVERDLIWAPETMLALVDHLQTAPCVVPMVMQENWFYDTWAYRLDGECFGAWPPFHERLRQGPGLPMKEGLVRIDTAGSLIAMRGDLARVCRFQPEDAIVGLCRDVYAHGGSVWLDMALSVRHPA